jgi:hypothetical protein
MLAFIAPVSTGASFFASSSTASAILSMMACARGFSSRRNACSFVASSRIVIALVAIGVAPVQIRAHELRHLEGDTFVTVWTDDLTHPMIKFAFQVNAGQPVSVDVEMFGTFVKTE